MFEHLDRNAQDVLAAAQKFARTYKQSAVDVDHLLLALLETAPVNQLLTGLQLSLVDLTPLLIGALHQDHRRSPSESSLRITFSPRMRRVMELAWLEADSLNEKTIAEIHLLFGIVREGKSRALNILLEGRSSSDPLEFLKDLYAALGGFADEKGDTDHALAYYRRIYQLDATDARIPVAYQHLLKDAGKTEKEKAALSRFDQYNIIDESEVIDEPTIAFDAVAGIDDPGSEYFRIRRIFELVFLYPEQYRELASEFGIANTGTLLLFGPTGVGKTYICKAMAGEFSRRTGKKLTFINARLSSVMDKWVGNTEKNITKLIEIALERSPSLLVLDEIDSLGGERAAPGTRDYRIDWVNHLLIELDRLKNSRKASLVVACTNAIDRVDIALRRRLGVPIIIPLPDAATRAQVFRLYVEKIAPTVRGNIDYDSLAKATVGFTPSDIEEVVQETINRVWLEIVDTLAKNSSMPSQKRQLRTDDFFVILNSKTPSVSISKWVKDSVAHLRANGDEAQAQRLSQIFKGYTTTDDFFRRGQKWFAQKM